MLHQACAPAIGVACVPGALVGIRKALCYRLNNAGAAGDSLHDDQVAFNLRSYDPQNSRPIPGQRIGPSRVVQISFGHQQWIP